MVLRPLQNVQKRRVFTCGAAHALVTRDTSVAALARPSFDAARFAAASAAPVLGRRAGGACDGRGAEQPTFKVGFMLLMLLLTKSGMKKGSTTPKHIDDRVIQTAEDGSHKTV